MAEFTREKSPRAMARLLAASSLACRQSPVRADAVASSALEAAAVSFRLRGSANSTARLLNSLALLNWPENDADVACHHWTRYSSGLPVAQSACCFIAAVSPRMKAS